MSLQHILSHFLLELRRFLSAQNFFLTAVLAAKKGNVSLDASLNEFESICSTEYADLDAYICSRFFVAYVSSFEIYLQDTMAFVLRKHPKKLGSTKFRLEEVLEVLDTDALIDRAIDAHLNEIMYKKPMEYMLEICALLSISPESLKQDWPVFVEAKARRDLGVHANWKCNATYLRKINEAGLTTSMKVGDSAVPNTDTYMVPTAKSLQKLAELITSLAVTKHAA